MATDIRRSLAESGYLVLPAFPQEELLAFASELGRPVGDTRDSSLVKALSPHMASNANKNTLSSRYGTGPFPYHTETAYWRIPATHLLLYCVNPGSGCRHTMLIDSQEWVLTRRDRSVLCNEPWKVVSGMTRFLCTLLRKQGETLAIRYDSECMSPAVASSVRSSALIDEFVASGENVEISWNAGDLLIFDNHRMVHRRGPSLTEDTDRILYRILLTDSREW